MELKDGMLVSCKINGNVVEKGKLVKGEKYWYVCQDIVEGTDLLDKKGFKYSYCFYKENDGWDVTDIKPYYTTNIEDVYVGARISDNVIYRKILCMIGNFCFVSRDKQLDSFDYCATIEDFKRWGYYLIPECPKPEEEVKEMTVRDVEKLVGKKVKIVKE